MDTLQIFLFGRFRVHHDQDPPSGLDTRKVQELFCFLLLQRDRPHSRESLASLLWSDTSTQQSKCYLRKALWQLQSALNDHQAGGGLLLVEPDWVQINPEASFWLDVAAFEQAASQVHGVPGRELDPDLAQRLHDAVALYRGDLLEGWYQDWCLYERERLQHTNLSLLDKLMDYSEAQGHYEAGLTYGTQILRYDGARERTHRRLMRLYYLAGHRTEALRQYERCVDTLEEALGVQPAQSTIALYEQICADRLSPAAPASEDLPTAAAPARSSSILSHLQQLRVALTELQYQVAQTIAAVDLSTNGRP